MNIAFGRLLKGSINSIAAYEGRTAPAIEENLGAQIGVSGSAIQRYKLGYVPPSPARLRSWPRRRCAGAISVAPGLSAFSRQQVQDREPVRVLAIRATPNRRGDCLRSNRVPGRTECAVDLRDARFRNGTTGCQQLAKARLRLDQKQLRTGGAIKSVPQRPSPETCRAAARTQPTAAGDPGCCPGIPARRTHGLDSAGQATQRKGSRASQRLRRQ